MIIVERLTKTYGNKAVLDRVTASFEPGYIHGLVGRNGSGKTVLLKCISGLLKPTSGEIMVFGQRVGRDIEIPDRLGAIIETPGFLPNYSGFKNLKMLAGIRGKIEDDAIKEAMERVGLNPDEHKHVRKYSLGMRQRLGIAQAIMENPKVLLLDEPMNGLDSTGVRDMRRLLDALRREGKTILMATHNPMDIRKLVDTVYRMDDGRLREITAQGE